MATLIGHSHINNLHTEHLEGKKHTDVSFNLRSTTSKEWRLPYDSVPPKRPMGTTLTNREVSFVGPFWTNHTCCKWTQPDTTMRLGQ